MKPRLRFEVLKRDCFHCVYCGRTPPEVSLHVDHVHPVTLGGGNTMDNLLTACEECNSGKGGRKLHTDRNEVVTWDDIEARKRKMREARRQAEFKRVGLIWH